ncbi:MAG: YolD-like family protein [Clostridiales bacterium]|nr:YolD-like family protein [Clostridiales bacterium]
MENNEQKYADVFNMPHHMSTKRPQMTRLDRAAQFAPFAALTGHDAAIKETARLTDQRVELDEGTKSILNEKLQMALDFAETEPEITVTHFVEDKKKSGSAYVEFTGVIKRIDEYERTVIFTDKTKISIDDICAIEGDIFNGLE